MPVLRKKLGEILVEMRALRPADVQAALDEQNATSERIGEIFIRRGMCKSARVIEALSAQQGLPGIDLTGESPPHNLQGMIDGSYAERNLIIPFRIEGEGRAACYHVAFASAKNPALLQEVEAKLRAKIKPYVALEGQLKDKIRRYYYAQSYGYDLSFHEGEGFKPRKAPGEAPLREEPHILGQAAPPPAVAFDRHPAATSMSDLGGPSAKIAALEEDLAKTKAMLAALVKLLAERKVITIQDFKNAVSREHPAGN